MKRLRIAIYDLGHHDVVCAQVIEQTHRVKEFGHDGACEYMASGMRLSSLTCPENTKGEVYVRGSATEHDHDYFTLPRADIDAVRRAVQQYNKDFGSSDASASTVHVHILE